MGIFQLEKNKSFLNGYRYMRLALHRSTVQLNNTWTLFDLYTVTKPLFIVFNLRYCNRCIFDFFELLNVLVDWLYIQYI